MLLGLLHDTIGCSDDKDCCICLRSTGDHVLHEIPVSGTIYDGEVELGGVETLVGDVDCDTPLALFFQVVHNPGELECGLAF